MYLPPSAYNKTFLDIGNGISDSKTFLHSLNLIDEGISRLRTGCSFFCNSCGNCQFGKLFVNGFPVFFQNMWKKDCICKSVRNVILPAQRMSNSVYISNVRFCKGTSGIVRSIPVVAVINGGRLTVTLGSKTAYFGMSGKSLIAYL